MGSVTTNPPSNGSPTATNTSNANPQPPLPAGFKIPEPKEKLNANPDAVYELLGIKWNDRKKMQVFTREVYDKHQLDKYETSFTRLPENVRKAAAEDIARQYPEVIAKCEGPWFATWILNRRHKTARTKRTGGADSGGGSGGGGGGGGGAGGAGGGSTGEGEE